MFKPTLSLVACATLVASLGADALTLESISITSNLFDQNEFNAPYSTEVYTSEDIEKSHAKDIYEFFTQQTSLITAPTYGNPYSQKLDLHGYGIGDGYQNIVVTLDGRRLNNIDMVSQLLIAIPVSSIERIEILKGSGIVAYGDGANAATVNIITKKGNHNELSFYAGNYRALGQSLYLSTLKDRYSYSVHIDHSSTDGTRVLDNTNNDRDAGKTTNGGAEISYRVTDDFEVHAGAQFSSYDTFYGGNLTLAQYEANPAQKGSSKTHQIYNTNVLNGGIVYTINPHYSLEVDTSREIKQNDSITWGADYRYNELTAKLNYDTESIKATLGMNGFWGERRSLGSTKTVSKDNQAAFLSSELNIQNQTFSAGGRIEQVDYTYNDTGIHLAQDNSLYGAELGYGLALAKGKSLFAHYAHAYQAPDIDRFFNYGGTFNGFIKPMKTDTYTIGYNNLTTENKFKASLFYVNLSNEIYYYPDPTYTNDKNTNIDKSHKYGLDLSDQWIINEQWNLYTNYNYVQAIIDQEIESGDNYTGNKLPGVSNHNIKATVSYLPTINTTIAITQVYRSKAYALNDFNNNFSQKQQAYHSTNISLNYAKNNYEIFAKINNLFDQSNGLWIKDNAIYPVDFTTTFTAGLKFIF